MAIFIQNNINTKYHNTVYTYFFYAASFMNIILSNKDIFAEVKIDDILQFWQVYKIWSRIVSRLLHLAATNKCKEFILRHIFPTKWNFTLIYLVGDHLGRTFNFKGNREMAFNIINLIINFQ